MARQKDGKKLAKSMVFLGEVKKEVSMMSMVVAKCLPSGGCKRDTKGI